MVNLIFTGFAQKDPEVAITDNGNTIAVFPVDIKEEPHVPPTRIKVIALGKQSDYAQRTIRKNSMVLVSGWFYIEHSQGHDCISVKARYLRALVN